MTTQLNLSPDRLDETPGARALYIQIEELLSELLRSGAVKKKAR